MKTSASCTTLSRPRAFPNNYVKRDRKARAPEMCVLVYMSRSTIGICGKRLVIKTRLRHVQFCH